jgi:uncharacterized lipoprotein YehR (DUF1307 family)
MKGARSKYVRKAAPVLVSAMLAFGITACGEIDQTAKIDKVYAGKKDSKAYEGAKFAGDKTKWEGALVERSKTQNEYNRTDVQKPSSN